MAIKRSAENRIMLAVGGLIAAAIAVTAIGTGWDRIDSAVMTEAEAKKIHDGYDTKFQTLSDGIDHQAIVNECRWLDDKLERIQHEIYELQRDSASTDLIHAKQTTLHKHERRYNALNCARVLRT